MSNKKQPYRKQVKQKKQPIDKKKIIQYGAIAPVLLISNVLGMNIGLEEAEALNTQQPLDSTSRTQTYTFTIPKGHHYNGVTTNNGQILSAVRNGDKVTVTVGNGGGYQHDRGGYTVPAHSKEVTGQSSPNYNDGTYKGSLIQYVVSGSYTPADSKSVRYTNTVDHDTYLTWSWAEKAAFQGGERYYNEGGYSGTLYPNGVSLSNGYVYAYSDGVVTRPASDTRVYAYRGTVTRPAYYVPDYETRYAYNLTMQTTPNNAPSIPVESVSMNTNSSKEYTLTITDDVDTITDLDVTTTQTGTGFTHTYDKLTGKLKVTATTHGNATGAITINATDRGGADGSGVLTGTRTIPVNIVNRAPQISNVQVQTTLERNTKDYDILFNTSDPDGSAVTDRVESLNPQLKITGSNKKYKIETGDIEGTYDFNIIATDAGGAETTQKVTVNIVNNKPEIVNIEPVNHLIFDDKTTHNVAGVLSDKDKDDVRMNLSYKGLNLQSPYTKDNYAISIKGSDLPLGFHTDNLVYTPEDKYNGTKSTKGTPQTVTYPIIKVQDAADYNYYLQNLTSDYTTWTPEQHKKFYDTYQSLHKLEAGKSLNDLNTTKASLADLFEFDKHLLSIYNITNAETLNPNQFNSVKDYNNKINQLLEGVTTSVTLTTFKERRDNVLLSNLIDVSEKEYLANQTTNTNQKHKVSYLKQDYFEYVQALTNKLQGTIQKFNLKTEYAERVATLSRYHVANNTLITMEQDPTKVDRALLTQAKTEIKAIQFAKYETELNKRLVNLEKDFISNKPKEDITTEDFTDSGLTEEIAPKEYTLLYREYIPAFSADYEGTGAANNLGEGTRMTDMIKFVKQLVTTLQENTMVEYNKLVALKPAYMKDNVNNDVQYTLDRIKERVDYTEGYIRYGSEKADYTFLSSNKPTLPITNANLNQTRETLQSVRDYNIQHSNEAVSAEVKETKRQTGVTNSKKPVLLTVGTAEDFKNSVGVEITSPIGTFKTTMEQFLTNKITEIKVNGDQYAYINGGNITVSGVLTDVADTIKQVKVKYDGIEHNATVTNNGDGSGATYTVTIPVTKQGLHDDDILVRVQDGYTWVNHTITDKLVYKIDASDKYYYLPKLDVYDGNTLKQKGVFRTLIENLEKDTGIALDKMSQGMINDIVTIYDDMMAYTSKAGANEEYIIYSNISDWITGKDEGNAKEYARYVLSVPFLTHVFENVDEVLKPDRSNRDKIISSGSYTQAFDYNAYDKAGNPLEITVTKDNVDLIKSIASNYKRHVGYTQGQFVPEKAQYVQWMKAVPILDAINKGIEAAYVEKNPDKLKVIIDDLKVKVEEVNETLSTEDADGTWLDAYNDTVKAVGYLDKFHKALVDINDLEIFDIKDTSSSLNTKYLTTKGVLDALPTATGDQFASHNTGFATYLQNRLSKVYTQLELLLDLDTALQTLQKSDANKVLTQVNLLLADPTFVTIQDTIHKGTDGNAYTYQPNLEWILLQITDVDNIIEYKLDLSDLEDKVYPLQKEAVPTATYTSIVDEYTGLLEKVENLQDSVHKTKYLAQLAQVNVKLSVLEGVANAYQAVYNLDNATYASYQQTLDKLENDYLSITQDTDTKTTTQYKGYIRQQLDELQLQYTLWGKLLQAEQAKTQATVDTILVDTYYTANRTTTSDYMVEFNKRLDYVQLEVDADKKTTLSEQKVMDKTETYANAYTAYENARAAESKLVDSVFKQTITDRLNEVEKQLIARKGVEDLENDLSLVNPTTLQQAKDNVSKVSATVQSFKDDLTYRIIILEVEMNVGVIEKELFENHRSQEIYKLHEKLNENKELLNTIITSNPSEYPKAQILVDKIDKLILIQEVEEKIELAEKKVIDTSVENSKLFVDNAQSEYESHIEYNTQQGVTDEDVLMQELKERLDELNHKYNARNEVEKLEEKIVDTTQDKQELKDAIQSTTDLIDKVGSLDPQYQAEKDFKDNLIERLDEVKDKLQALESTEKAEETFKQEDVDNARNDLTQVEEGVFKEELQDRLDEVQKVIDVENKLNDLDKDKGTSDSKDVQDKIEEIQKEIDDLKDGDKKDELQDKVDELQKENDIYKEQENDAERYVEKAEGVAKVKPLNKEELQKAIDEAQVKVDTLRDGSPKKDELNGRLEVLRDFLQDYIDFENKALQAVEKAEKTLLQPDHNIAKGYVNLLEEGVLKTELTQRLEVVQQFIMTEKLVTKAEKAETWDTFHTAQDAVNKLPDWKAKQDLQDRLDQLKEKLEYKDALKRAEDAVDKAGDTLKQEDIDKAQDEINKLPDGKDKDNLQDILDNIIKDLENLYKEIEDKLDELEKNFDKDLADNIQDLINKLPDGAKKDELQDRLDSIIKDKELADKYKEIEEKLDDLEKNFDKDKADNLQKEIDKLPDGDKKDELQDHLDNIIKDKELEDKYKEIEDKLEDLKNNYDKDKVDDIQKEIDKLPDGDKKDELQDHLDSIIKDKEMEDKYKEIDDKLDDLKNNYDKDKADDIQKEIDKLPDGDKKDELQDKLDEINKNQSDKDKDKGKLDTTDKELENKYKEIEEKLNDLEKDYSKDKVDSIQKEIDSLPDGDKKDELQNRLDEINKQHNQDAYDKAKDLVEKAEKERTQETLDEARDAVNSLPKGKDKDRLTDRLDKLEQSMLEDKVYQSMYDDKNNVTKENLNKVGYENINKEGQDMVNKHLDTIRGQQSSVADIKKAVKDAIDEYDALQKLIQEIIDLALKNQVSKSKMAQLGVADLTGYDLNMFVGLVQKAVIELGRGSITKDTLLSLLERSKGVQGNFEDTEGHWSKDNIDKLVQYGLIDGGGLFSPNADISRAQYAVILSRTLNLERKGSNPFQDIQGQWYEDYVVALYEKGMTVGVTDIAYVPNAPVTRQQSMAMLGRLIEAEGVHIQDATDLKEIFNDYNKVHDYAKPYIEDLVAADIVSGDNDILAPKNNLTRGQMAKIVSKTIEFVNNGGKIE